MQHEDEVAFVNNTIERLDVETLQGLSLQIDLRRRLNDIQATTAVLPLEILSTIFKCAVDADSSGILPLIVLGRVSSHWRRVAWSAPRLWTRLYLEVPAQQSIFEHKINIVRLYLQNAQSIPMALTIKNHGTAWPSPESLFELVFRDNPEKLKSFICRDTLPSYWWQSICDNVQSELPNLRQMVLGLHDHIRPSNRPPFSLPSLTHLSIWGAPFIPSQFPLGQLTTVSFSNSVPESQCLLLLTHSPQLESFTYGSFGREQRAVPVAAAGVLDDGLSMLSGESITLPNLKEFLWPFTNNVCSQFILKHLRFPSLHRLCIRGMLDTTTGGEEIRRFKQVFLSSLTRLTFLECPMRFMCGYDPPHLGGILWSSLPSTLQELHLYSVGYPGDLNHIFRHFTLRFHAPDSSGLYHNVIPRLKFLSLRMLRGRSFEHRSEKLSDSTIFPSFVEMLRSRRDVPPSHSRWEDFSQLECIDFHGRYGYGPLRDGLVGEDMEPHLEVYERLVGEGLRVELRFDGNSVRPWVCRRKNCRSIHLA